MALQGRFAAFLELISNQARRIFRGSTQTEHQRSVFLGGHSVSRQLCIWNVSDRCADHVVALPKRGVGHDTRQCCPGCRRSALVRQCRVRDRFLRFDTPNGLLCRLARRQFGGHGKKPRFSAAASFLSMRTKDELLTSPVDRPMLPKPLSWATHFPGKPPKLSKKLNTHSKALFARQTLATTCWVAIFHKLIPNRKIRHTCQRQTPHPTAKTGSGDPICRLPSI